MPIFIICNINKYTFIVKTNISIVIMHHSKNNSNFILRLVSKLCLVKYIPDTYHTLQ